MIKTLIIFLIFKRPEETALVFEQIRKARPPKLFIVADGPRNDGERGLVEKTREVVGKIDWPCEVYKNFSDKNLGCRRRVWSGLDWAFNQLGDDTDGAIILEDDCLPDQSFFKYAEEMLEKYKNNDAVMHIGGTCFQQLSPTLAIELSTGTTNLTKPQNSYYFSHISQIWGWATWKRAWKKYDGAMKTWPSLKGSGQIRSIFPNRFTYDYWSHMFDRMYENKMDTWDVAWTYTVFKEHGLCIMPTVNLIKNIGIGPGATHKISRFANQETEPMHFPLTHPSKIEVDREKDLITYKLIYGINNSLRNSFVSWVKEKLPFLKNVKRFVS